MLERVKHFFRRHRKDRELAEELELHRQLTEDRLVRSGIPPGQAAAESRRIMGNMTLAREDARGVWLSPWLESVAQDVRYATRSLRRQPAFTATAILTLGVGIGLNTTVATMFATVYWRRWAVPRAQEVVQILEVDSRRADSEFAYESYQALAGARLTSIVATSCGTSLRAGECVVKSGSDRLSALFVSANYFDALGIALDRGRAFRADEDNASSPAPVAVISYRIWEQRFASNPEILGQTLLLDDEPFTVIGVASRQFNGEALLRRDVWLPLAAGRILRPTTRDTTWVELAGRLGPAVSREQAQAELQSLYPFKDRQTGQPIRILLVGANAVARPNDREELLAAFTVMFVGVGLVLLLACANVGNLLLARVLARGREIAVRASIGAGRARLVRQLLTESLVLASFAAALATWAAFVLPGPVMNLALAASDTGSRLAIDVTPDTGTLAFTVGLIAATCLAFGLAPALHATNVNVIDALKNQSRRVAGRFPLRATLLAVQVCISVVLLVAASLLFRAIQHASGRDLGFRTEGIRVVSFEPPASYSLDRIREASRQLVQELDTAPGSDALGVASATPLVNGGRYRALVRRADDRQSEGVIVSLLAVSPGYFGVLGLPIVAGRPLDRSDIASEGVLVNEELAKQLWPGNSPLGREIVSGWSRGGTVTRRVVGVVANDDTEAMALRLGPPRARVYEPVLGPRRLSEMHVGDDLRHVPDVLVPPGAAGAPDMIAALAARIDDRIRLRVVPLESMRDRMFSEARISAVFAGVLGITALILASIGVFGVFAYTVRQQTRDIGVRMALGAQSSHVVRSVFRVGLRPLLAGVLAGLCGASWAGQFLRTTLFGLSPFDPLSYLAVMAILTIAAVVALSVPAWRATRVDPLIALRTE